MGQSDWYQIEEEVRGQIKEALLHTLGSNSDAQIEQMKDICLCVSAIAVVEIPTGAWPEFVQIMSAQGDQNDSQFYKMAGIHNLGLVMEALLPTDLQADDINMIWGTMLNNIDPQNLDLTRIVAKSIARLAPATVANFQHDAQRAKIMEGIFNLLKIQDQEIIHHTLEALIEIARLNYWQMEAYLDDLLEITKQLIEITDDDHKVAGYSIEVWNTLCEEEIEVRRNPEAQREGIIRSWKWRELATLFYNGLAYTGFDEGDHTIDDDNEQSMSLQCSTALGLLA